MVLEQNQQKPSIIISFQGSYGSHAPLFLVGVAGLFRFPSTSWSTLESQSRKNENKMSKNQQNKNKKGKKRQNKNGKRAEEKS